MLNIDKFLEKFYKSVKKTDFHKEKVLSILEKYTKIKFSLGDVEVKNYIVFVKTSPGVLNKIFIDKNKILEEINLIDESLVVVDIKQGY